MDANHNPAPVASTCRPIDRDYAARFSGSGRSNLEAVLGVGVDELASLPAGNLAALAREHPLEAFSVLTMAGVEAWRVLPSDVLVTVVAAIFGIDRKPFLALPQGEAEAALWERVEQHNEILESLPFGVREQVIERSLKLGGDFARAVREVCGDDQGVLMVH